MRTRFLPNQLRIWTDGKLFRSQKSIENTEKFYPCISTDTRVIKKGEVFLALHGDNFDGHDFIDAAIEKGAGMLIIEEKSDAARKLLPFSADTDMPDILLVNDTLRAYMAIAAGYRQTLDTSIIGVTGSVGKTTTRRMIHQMLASQIITDQSDANQNNQIGISNTILSADPEAQVLVVEIAIDRLGEMEELSALVRPDIAIITGIGHSHALHLGSIENIFKEKMDLLKHMKDNSFVLLNGKDPMLRNWAKQNKDDMRYAVWFVADLDHKDEILENGFPVFWSENIEIDKESTKFTAKCSFSAEETWFIELPFAAPHTIEAVLFGLASAYIQGIDMQIASSSVYNFSNTGARQQIVNLNDNICLFDDSYNSSTEAMESGLITLSRLSEPKDRIGVFADIRELGQYAAELHLKAAKQIISAGFREVLLIGDNMRNVKDYIMSNAPDIKTSWYSNRDDLESAVLNSIQAGDTIMVKGSRFFELEHTADLIREKYSQE
ncbi:MAG: UDP-N-acetylmuramoyl-tripeptide--D-alanyl-D-alanine ligase [Clostridiaceae bacterium]|nr:UDP-N-acetylmuramoyl-tripeptide--D-alanyl-D-alanine ligase [Clostridiaceae bacterium]